jgi:DNA primase
MTAKTAFIDFAQLKERVGIESVVSLLGIEMRRNGEQWRGPCPACKQGGHKALAVNTAKNKYFCFVERKGGDIIALAAHIRGISQREAAEYIDQSVGGSPAHDAPPAAPQRSPQPHGRKQGFDAEAYAKTLDPAHAALGALMVSPETMSFFRAGYSSSGINRGRLALPLHDRQGQVVCYCGRALSDAQQPTISVPNGIDPHAYVFNAHNVKEGELTLVRDPLGVLQAYEHGVENVVAFLTPVTPQQLEQLASLMDEKRCSTVELA